jgi:poly(A) polymerase
LIAAETAFGWSPDPLLRLAAIVPPTAERMQTLGERLKVSGAEKAELMAWVNCPEIGSDLADPALRALLYRHGASGVTMRLKLALANQVSKGDDDLEALRQRGYFSRALDIATAWRQPQMPVKGADLMQLGWEAGPKLGDALRQIEEKWIASDFTAKRDDLIAALDVAS